MPNINPTDIAAWFGAFGTIALFFFEIYKYSQNKAKVKIKVAFNQELLSADWSGRFNRNKRSYWVITIINEGSKSIKLRQVNFIYKSPKEKHTGGVITEDVNGPVVPFVLEDGDYRTITVDDELVNPKEVMYVEVVSNTGKKFKHKLKYV